MDTYVAYFPDRETDPSQQSKCNKSKKCIKATHLIIPVRQQRETDPEERRKGRFMYILPIAFGQLEWLPWRLLHLLKVSRGQHMPLNHVILYCAAGFK